MKRFLNDNVYQIRSTLIVVTFPNHTAKERSEKHQNPGNPQIQSNVFPVGLLNFSFAGKSLDMNRTDHTEVDVMTD